MVVRTSTVEPLESPISSAKYNAEMNDIYEHLTRFDAFNTSPNPPDIPDIGTVWYDSNYDPPLEKRWNGTEWQWYGTYIYATGDAFPLENPAKGAVRVNSETGSVEYWTGTLWVAVTIEGLGASFSGNGAYLWDREPRVPTGFNNPVIGCGFDIDPNSSQGASTGSVYRDIFVIGGNSKPFSECMCYSLNAGATDWLDVVGLDSVATSLSIDPNTLVTVEKILGFNGDYSLPTGVTSSPFIFAIIRAAVGNADGYHYVIGIRVTDDGANLAGTAVKGILVPEALTTDPLAACVYNGKLRIAGADVNGASTMWDISWTSTNFELDANPIPLTGYNSPISAIVDYFTLHTPSGFLADGRNFGYIQALPAVGPGVDEPVRVMGFVQPDNRLVAVTESGKLYNGTNGSVATLPTWEMIDTFDGVEQFVIDGLVSAKRHTEIWCGYVTLYGLQYGAIFERKMGSKDYQVVWQSDIAEIACSMAYTSIRNSFLTITEDPDTKELVGIYDSDLRSVSDYFASINQQMQTLTTIVNKAMYRGGARKGEIRAWTKDPNLIPEGWALCDGSYNEEYGGVTPNLIGRVLRGAVYTEGEQLKTGGSDSFTLATVNMPSHSHSLSNHTHQVTAIQHTHTMNHTHIPNNNSHYHTISGGGSSGTIYTGSAGGYHGHQSQSSGPGGWFVTGGSTLALGTDALGGSYAATVLVSLTHATTTDSTNIDHQHTVNINVSVPNATNSTNANAGVQAYNGSTGQNVANNGTTGAPSTNTTGATGSTQPVTNIPSHMTVFWIIATRDHAAAEGIDTSFLSVDQMMAILEATAPNKDNPFLTKNEVLSLPAGSPGLSAYELAVADGFQGTNAQWLASLKGPHGKDGYDYAIEHGFVGTVQEWLDAMQGADGADGQDGDSGYQVAVAEGFTGTAQEWLDSLVGPQGPQGIQGLPGTNGANGVDGAPGATGPRGATGAQGPKGDTGAHGIQGPAGAKGANGATGPQGIQGVAGTNGVDGVDGEPGPQGPMGPSGSARVFNVLGVLATAPTDPGNENEAYQVGAAEPYNLWFWDSINSAWVDGGVISAGPKGDDGADGAQGPAGPKGDTGPEGPAGPQGIQGEPGNDGADGADGAQGPAGEQGPEGPTGPAGEDGADGEAGPQGPTGPQGIQGIQGEAGPQGPIGPAGATGPQGPTGPAGPQGPPGEESTTPNTMMETPFVVISALTATAIVTNGTDIELQVGQTHTVEFETGWE